MGPHANIIVDQQKRIVGNNRIAAEGEEAIVLYKHAAGGRRAIAAHRRNVAKVHKANIFILLNREGRSAAKLDLFDANLAAVERRRVVHRSVGERAELKIVEKNAVDALLRIVRSSVLERGVGKDANVAGGVGASPLLAPVANGDSASLDFVNLHGGVRKVAMHSGAIQNGWKSTGGSLIASESTLNAANDDLCAIGEATALEERKHVNHFGQCELRVRHASGEAPANGHRLVARRRQRRLAVFFSAKNADGAVPKDAAGADRVRCLDFVRQNAEGCDELMGDDGGGNICGVNQIEGEHRIAGEGGSAVGSRGRGHRKSNARLVVEGLLVNIAAVVVDGHVGAAAVL